MTPEPPAKLCPSCGRRFTWRRKWKRCWEQVRFCSERCRHRRIRPVDRSLETAILELLASRKGTICPSEAARAVWPERWRELLQASRAAGRRLANRGDIVVLQGRRPVDPSDARGAIRYAKRRSHPFT